MILHAGQFYTAWQVIVDTEVFTSPDWSSPLVETLKLIKYMSSLISLSFQFNISNSIMHKK